MTLSDGGGVVGFGSTLDFHPDCRGFSNLQSSQYGGPGDLKIGMTIMMIADDYAADLGFEKFVLVSLQLIG